MSNVKTGPILDQTLTALIAEPNVIPSSRRQCRRLLRSFFSQTFLEHLRCFLKYPKVATRLWCIYFKRYLAIYYPIRGCLLAWVVMPLLCVTCVTWSVIARFLHAAVILPLNIAINLYFICSRRGKVEAYGDVSWPSCESGATVAGLIGGVFMMVLTVFMGLIAGGTGVLTLPYGLTLPISLLVAFVPLMMILLLLSFVVCLRVLR